MVQAELRVLHLHLKAPSGRFNSRQLGAYAHSGNLLQQSHTSKYCHSLGQAYTNHHILDVRTSNMKKSWKCHYKWEKSNIKGRYGEHTCLWRWNQISGCWRGGEAWVVIEGMAASECGFALQVLMIPSSWWQRWFSAFGDVLIALKSTNYVICVHVDLECFFKDYKLTW
jgi:hypothetical protein